MGVRLAVVALLAASGACFGPALPAVDCGEGNLCPSGTVCQLPERICRPPSTGADDASPADSQRALDAGADASNLPALVDRGLLFRYYIDEASSGNGPTSLVDSATDPLALPLDYGGGNLRFTEVGGNRGLSWQLSNGPGAASVAATNTKLEDLDGLEQATCESVVDLDASGLLSRVAHIGPANSAGDLSLLAANGGSISLAYDGSFQTTWPSSMTGARIVIHSVFDSSLDNEDRLRLFVNGALVPNPVGDQPIGGGQISLSDEPDFLIGNTQNGNRSFRGVIHYHACYVNAFSTAEVANNAARLIVDDDGPG